jgi:hypothetical protein
MTRSDSLAAAGKQARADLEAGTRFLHTSPDYSTKPATVWALRDLRDYILGVGERSGYQRADADLLDRLLAGELASASLSTGDRYELRTITPLVTFG